MEAILMACDNLSGFAVLSSNDMAGHVLQQTLRAGPDLKVQVTCKQQRRYLRINKIPLWHDKEVAHTHFLCLKRTDDGMRTLKQTLVLQKKKKDVNQYYTGAGHIIRISSKVDLFH